MKLSYSVLERARVGGSSETVRWSGVGTVRKVFFPGRVRCSGADPATGKMFFAMELG